MTSQLWIFRARSILWPFMVPRMILQLTKANRSTHLYSTSYVFYTFKFASHWDLVKLNSGWGKIFFICFLQSLAPKIVLWANLRRDWNEERRGRKEGRRQPRLGSKFQGHRGLPVCPPAGCRLPSHFLLWFPPKEIPDDFFHLLKKTSRRNLAPTLWRQI